MAPRPQDHELAEIARRIKAARLLRSTEETITASKLAKDIKAQGLVEDWLHQLERARAAQEPEVSEAMLGALERVLRVPRRWFTAPLEELFDDPAPPLEADDPKPLLPRPESADTQHGAKNPASASEGTSQ